MNLHLPVGSLKTSLGWSRYRDANPVLISPLAGHLATGHPLLTVIFVSEYFCKKTPRDLLTGIDLRMTVHFQRITNGD